MYLKSLEIKGFKSFADGIKIDFGTGITAIVGPNGSGKSNISDAIRWVLGEQSAKSLRGGNMQDVIFSGTQTRKPLGFAEVSLTVDNRDHALSIDYDEVVITRRVFRSGESEYLINQSPVRLKDVHELLMDTGVGRDGYSIISQGKISELIAAKAEDRRQIFEEAAGITKFRYRKEEAERKIQRTQENMVRVSDIIAELEHQVEPLRVQSERAKQYLLLREELKGLDISVSLENVEKFRAVLAETEQNVRTVTEQTKQVEQDIERIEAETGAMFDGIESTDVQTAQTRERQQASSAALSHHRSEIGILKNRMEQNDEAAKRIGQELAGLQGALGELAILIEENSKTDEQLALSQAEMEQTMLQLEQQQKQLDATMEQRHTQTKQINDALIEKMNLLSDQKAQAGNVQTLAQSYEVRKEELQQQLQQKTKEHRLQQQKADELAQQCARQQQEVEQKRQMAQDKQQKVSRAESKLAALQEELSTVSSKLAQAETRQTLLKDLEQSFDQYSHSVKSVMQAYQKGTIAGCTIYGTVAQLMQVESRYTTAIEVALGSAAQQIVTKTEIDAKAAISYLKQSKQGRATFLPLSAARGGRLNEPACTQCDGYLGIAADLVQCDDAYRKVVDGLLGRVVVVDNIDHAIAMAKRFSYRFRIVTLEGEALFPGGSLSGGSRNKTTSLFARANELVSLSETIRTCRARQSTLQADIHKKSGELQQEQQTLDHFTQEVRTAEQRLMQIEGEVAHQQALLQMAQQAQQQLEQQSLELEEQMDQMKQQHLSLMQQAKALEAEIDALQQQAQQSEQSVAVFVEQRQQLGEQLVQQRLSLSAVMKDRELQQEKRGMLETRQTELTLQMQQKQQNKQELYRANKDMEEEIETKNQQIAHLTAELERLGEQIANAEQQRKQAQDTIRSQQEQLKQLRQQQLLLQQELGRVMNKQQKTELELDNTISRLWDEYELTLTTAEEYRKGIESVSNAQRRISALRGSIRELGNVNVDAIEEYRTVKERYDFLIEQRNDLEEARKNLEQVIKNMMGIMKEQFAQQFELINKHFSETFCQLFGGGKAQLKLTDPSDLLASGVDIDVQPPGKSLKSLIQMSGGEQAFVSIALLFAILKVRPAPFYVLDEIEAALDDVNVYRFADYLKQFSKESQFVVVTHRRGTMEAANILYGVTMQERGVTKLLALNIDEVVNAAAK